MRKVINLNKNWKFHEHNVFVGPSFIPFYRIGFDDSDWQDINVPHDNSILSEFSEKNPSGPRGGYAKTRLCYYNKHFNLQKDDLQKRAILEFQGVYMKSTVYINGVVLGTYPYGYTTFSYDITPYITEGENVISVMVDNEVQPASRWYSGTGIYRPVNLYLTEKSYLKTNELVITTPVVSKENATVNIDFNLYNDNNESQFYNIQIDIMSDGKAVCSKRIDKSVAYNNYTDVSTQIQVNKPKLWCNKTPYLYDCIIKIMQNNCVVDEVSQTFGIRKIEYSPDKGFIINGRKEMIKGVCIHHDNGCLGSAAYREAFIRKIEVSKQMGANAIRTSHNPEAPEFLDLCDQYGMYVMEEAFDEWEVGKRPRIFGDLNARLPIFAYAQYFKEWADKDLSAMIKRDRNHPCIVMWSIGNEIEALRRVEGEKIAQNLIHVVHTYDKTRPTTSAFNGIAEIRKTQSPYILDICGYNYGEKFYEEDHENNPQRCIVGSETASMTPFEKRGDYTQFLQVNYFDNTNFDGEADPERSNIKESVNSNIRARVFRGEQSMISHLKNDFIIGMFICTGIDYIGEPTPCVWPSISSYFAPIDRAMLPKDAFYFYKSCWSDEDVLHILPHWTFDDVKELPVWCYTNCDEVELFVNDKSYGKKKLNKSEALHLEWENVKYEKGTIKAVGYRNGRMITSEIKTAGETSDIELTIDRKSISEDELFYATVRLMDKNSTTIPNKDINVEFSGDDNVSFVACDNGDPTFTHFTDNNLPTLAGYARAVFRGINIGTGKITVSAMINGTIITKNCTITIK